MIKMVSDNEFLLNTVTASIRAGRTENAVEAEALLKAYDSQINLWSGQDRAFAELSFPNMTFQTQEFADQEELEAYIADDNYGGIDTPGICFAFHIKEKGINDYELELMFNDQIVLDYKSIPD